MSLLNDVLMNALSKFQEQYKKPAYAGMYDNLITLSCNGCSGTCEDDCRAACEGDCRGFCQGECYGSCSGDCAGDSRY